MPYLAALTDIQHVVDEIHGRPPTDIKILAIQYGSVTADITGGIRDTVELILDLVVRWRRENKKRLADLEAAQKEVEIKQKEIEVEQARVAMDSDAEQAADKARLAKAQADELELKNQQLQLELMKLTLEIVEQVKPDLPGEQKLLYAMKMVDSTRLIAMSPLELVDVEEIEAEPVGPAEAESKEDEAGQDDNEKDS
jgi:seryl-tRNA synthetase